MNRLHQLRKEIGLTQRELGEKTNIVYTIIAYLESEKRPFRQSHINKLTSFFNVTTDYLMGRNDNGLYVWLGDDDEPTLLTESEYKKLKVEITLLERQPLNFKINGTKEVIENFETSFYVHREVKEKTMLDGLLNKQLEQLSKKMTTEDLEKAIKFIKEYIIK